MDLPHRLEFSVPWSEDRDKASPPGTKLWEPEMQLVGGSAEACLSEGWSVVGDEALAQPWGSSPAPIKKSEWASLCRQDVVKTLDFKIFLIAQVKQVLILATNTQTDETKVSLGPLCPPTP